MNFRQRRRICEIEKVCSTGNVHVQFLCRLEIGNVNKNFEQTLYSYIVPTCNLQTSRSTSNLYMLLYYILEVYTIYTTQLQRLLCTKAEGRRQKAAGSRHQGIDIFLRRDAAFMFTRRKASRHQNFLHDLHFFLEFATSTAS